MTELRCADGTVVQISAETEAELRKAFGRPEPTFKVGDIFYRPNDERNYLKLIVDGDNCVGLRYTKSSVGVVDGYETVKDVNAITMAEVHNMTRFPDGLRHVETFTVTEE